jgi:phosphoribosylformimino-5-aminoimidazole carboxamide ribotide isomerase
MTLIPAIDLLGGACVRLTKGNYDRVERYSGDPVEVARRFAAAGARWIHLVDLDAARGTVISGRHSAADSPSQPPASSQSPAAGHNQPAAVGHNLETIHRIARAVSCNIQVGGGIRRLQDVEELLEAGAKRLIVGTAVVKDPEEVRRWCGRYPGVLWAGIDAERGAVKISGWQRAAELQDVELAEQVRQMGLAGIVYTSIGRDGTMQGPDIERTNRIAEVSGLPVILSGGIGNMEDVRQVLEQRHPGVEGLIIGKAIYRGRVDLQALFKT